MSVIHDPGLDKGQDVGILIALMDEEIPWPSASAKPGAFLLPDSNSGVTHRAPGAH